MLRMSVVLLFAMMLTGCSLSTGVQPTPTLASPLAPTGSPLPTPPRSPVPTDTPGERPPASAAIPSDAEASVRAAVSDWAAKQKVAPEAVQVVSVEAVDWSDTSLGCPQPGMFYAQIIVQGYRIVLSAGSLQAEYHADRNGRVVTCGK